MPAITESTKRKLSLLQLAEELGNVSKACRIMGYHGDTFDEVRHAFQVGGVAVLAQKKRGPRGPHLNQATSRSRSRYWRCAWSVLLSGTCLLISRTRMRKIHLVLVRQQLRNYGHNRNNSGNIGNSDTTFSLWWCYVRSLAIKSHVKRDDTSNVRSTRKGEETKPCHGRTT